MSKSKSAQIFIDDVFQTIDQSPLVSAGQLRIWGGRFEEAQLADFLQAWQSVPDGRFQWAMVEEVSQFVVKAVIHPADALPGETRLLERMRVFGPAGDLDLRRDRTTFHWRFIGEERDDWPDLVAFAPKDFWQAQPEPKPHFREVTRAYFQWRPGDGRASGEWREGTSLGEKDMLMQKQYLDNGRIAFVRYVDFKEYIP